MSGRKLYNILVVGGAGYIGSHMVKRLLELGHRVVTVDDLSTGHRDAVLGGVFEQGSLADPARLGEVFRNHRFDAVMHFASFIAVGESYRAPARYYRNNVVNTVNLLDAMVAQGVKKFVFSSTAAVYGEPVGIPITEAHPKEPVNPYGWTKLMVEQILADYANAYGLASVSLRYFNAAGADPDARLGERHEPETHLIPLALQAAAGRRPMIEIFGNDYPTSDGTCVRDYIHVSDLCDAHVLALGHVLDREGAAAEAFNLGNGAGFTVREVIAAAERVTGRAVPVKIASRRAGDPAVLVADSSRASRELGWQPKFSSLDDIVRHAWNWETRATKR